MNENQHLEITNRIDRYIQQRMNEENIPSVVLALTDRSETIHVTTHGFADVAARIPATENTLYQTGSIGKSFTAIALLQLQDEGRIDLKAPVTDYLPWFSVGTQFGPILLHHLVSHTAGIIRGTDFSPDPRYEVWALRDTQTSHPPGENFHYSNIGYKALGLVLERLEGRPYAEIIADRVLAPLGMSMTCATITHEHRSKLAVGYDRMFDDRPSHRDDPIVPTPWFQTNTADGCLASSVIDLATYLRLYMNEGTVNGEAVISSDNFTTMTGKIINTGNPEEPSWYGYGIRTSEQDGHRVIGHGGGMVGYFSDMTCIPDLGIGAVAMVNGIGDPAEFSGYALGLLRAAAEGKDLLGVPKRVDPFLVPDAGDFAGAYVGSIDTLTIEAAGANLYLQVGDVSERLEPRGTDRFFVGHPMFRRHLLAFGRDSSGKVVEVFHGNNWFRGASYSGPTTFAEEEDLSGLAGDYRSHNPWYPLVRVSCRKGDLVLGSETEPLIRFDDGTFGHSDQPERLRFDTFVDGKALRLTYACNDFYRFFTGDEEQ